MQYDMFLIINIRNNNSHNKTNRCTNVKIIFLHTICHNSDVLRSIVIIFGEVFDFHFCVCRILFLPYDINTYVFSI